jgi:hypothetical protein
VKLKKIRKKVAGKKCAATALTVPALMMFMVDFVLPQKTVTVKRALTCREAARWLM